MKFTIERINGEVAFETDAETLAQAMRLAVTSGAKLRGADLRGADLSWADLSWADLRGADLRGADLSWADLRGADLRGADLSGAKLRGADLSWADLCGADLRGADLSWAKLRGAKLRGADLRWADLSWARDIFSLGPCDGWWVYAVRHENGPRFAVGCRWFLLREAREYWVGKDNRTQVMRAVEFLAAEAAARGWEMPRLDGGGE